MRNFIDTITTMDAGQLIGHLSALSVLGLIAVVIGLAGKLAIELYNNLGDMRDRNSD